MSEIIGKIQPGTIVLDASTSEPATSQSMAALGEKHGFAFVDGPVSGGPAAANAGTMTMLLGGDPRAIETLKPVLDILTAKTVVVGGSGAGHAAKIANNMLCAAQGRRSRAGSRPHIWHRSVRFRRHRGYLD